MYIEGMNKEMHAKSGMHKPRYTQRKRQSNIYMKEYIDEL